MTDVYAACPSFENRNYLLRPVQTEDVKDLLEVYSDEDALPFFNSDNCHGDIFYYTTEERMRQAMEFWQRSYESGWFVRWAIVDKAAAKVVGTIELFHREAPDDFNHVGLLRIDLKHIYEKTAILAEIMKLIVPPAYQLFDCDTIATKIPMYAVSRMGAALQLGFEKSEKRLIGTMDGYAYKDYWTRKKVPEGNLK